MNTNVRTKYITTGIVGLVILFGIYWWFIAPWVFFSDIKKQILGFSVKEVSHEPILAGGKYFGEKYELIFLNKEGLVLAPYIKNYFGVKTKTELSNKSTHAVAFSHGEPILMNQFNCRAMMRSSSEETHFPVEEKDALKICGPQNTTIIAGVSVTEYEKDHIKYLCTESKYSKAEIIKNIHDSQPQKETIFSIST